MGIPRGPIPPPEFWAQRDLEVKRGPRGPIAPPESLGPQDLDPLEAAASPITPDALLTRAGRKGATITENDRRQAELMAHGMSADDAAKVMAREWREGIEARAAASRQAEIDAEAASRLRGPDSVQYDENGRPGLNTPTSVNLGEYDKIDPITGRPVPMTDREREQAARSQYKTWANADPGSSRQRDFDPQAHAQWIDDTVAAHLAKQAEYDATETPQMKQDRLASEARVRTSNADVRQKVREGAQRRRDNEDALKSPQQKIAERNRILVQQNPMLTLGDPSLNEWQQYVLSERLLGGQRGMGPNEVRATRNTQLNAFGQRVAAAMAQHGLPDPSANTAAQEVALSNLPAEQRARISVSRKEPIGTGLSAEHVNAIWASQMQGMGPSSHQARLKNFADAMIGLGYSPDEIQSYVDMRLRAPAGTPGQAAPPSNPVNPGVSFQSTMGGG